jgi:hypothetical protein
MDLVSILKMKLMKIRNYLQTILIPIIWERNSYLDYFINVGEGLVNVFMKIA